jgi:hypothetical protein
MDDPRIDPLEHRVALLEAQVATLSDVLLRTADRTLALAELLTRHGFLTADEIAAIHEAATCAVEFSPEYEEFRHLRRLIQGGAVSEPDERP